MLEGGGASGHRAGDMIRQQARSLRDQNKASIEEMKQDLQRELSGETGGTDAAQVPPAAASIAPPAPAARGQVASQDRNQLAQGLVHPHEQQSLLVPQPAQINQAVNFVLNSAFIQENVLYSNRISTVTFRYLPDDPTVNAFATDHPYKLPDGSAVDPPAILLLGGVTCAIRLTAAALAAHIRLFQTQKTYVSPLPAAMQALGGAILKQRFQCDVSTCDSVFKKFVQPMVQVNDDRFYSLARSYASAMDMFIIAHEAGHIALGHTLGRQQNYDTSRNQEREADSFASSAMSSSPFREYLFLGQVFVAAVFTWINHVAEQLSGPSELSSHPHSRERFLNAMRSSTEAAKEAEGEFGLSEEFLMDILPPTDPT